ncbi:LIC20035 family adhesin [Leptospira yanagawae]|uniref:LIC20035 family adhesin n=1 Tax=Leptospira yanagawae TaxID=293069 RepID=A0ABY2M5D5_9LEPT|nr:LIC20035 family adhesin [Leptospira yanagawae]TGL20957.1 LIC20035 family adhesin [Leptospira yanagawae]
MNRKFYAALITTVLIQCSGASVKDGSGDQEFELKLAKGKWIRTERFKNSGGIRAVGEVKAECGGTKCTEDQVAKFAPPKIKSLPKHGIWEEYIQFEQPGSTPENPKFKSTLDQVGEYIDGKKTGIWKKPDPENPQKFIAETPWTDGKKEGVAKTFDKQGNVTSETTYVDDKKNGPYFRKNSKGEWIEKGNFKDNEEEGEWLYHFVGADGNGIKTKVSYSNGLKNGLEINYYKDGVVESQGNYVSDVRTGPWKMFGGKGNLLAEGNYSKKENSENLDIKYERSGIWKEYYPDGKLFGQGPRKHTRTGEWKFYYKNGQVAYHGNMANESMLETAKVYDQTGKILGEGKLFFSLVKIDEELQDLKLNYKPSIPFTYFYPSGKKRMVIRSTEDATEYSEDGRELGKGPVEPQGRKMGCWTIGGKTEYYMIDKPMPKMTASQCK